VTGRHTRVLYYGLPLLTVQIIALTGCVFNQNMQAVTDANEQFHRRLASGDYDAVYNDATDDFKKALSRDGARAYLTRVSETMGACGHAQITNIAVNTGFSGVSISIKSHSICTNGPLDESLVWMVRQRVIKLDSYVASSPLF
jgi:hypothetical protein